VLILLVLSVAINYFDRGALSVSAPLLRRELSLSPTQMGLLFSAFFWSYSVFQLASGWLVDRYDVKRVFAAGFLLWSLATLRWAGSRDLAGCSVLA
jgi:MFS family permease